MRLNSLMEIFLILSLYKGSHDIANNKRYNMNMGETKFCLNCGDPISRITPSGKKLSENIYSKKVYCNRKCANKHRKKNKIGWHSGNFYLDHHPIQSSS